MSLDELDDLLDGLENQKEPEKKEPKKPEKEIDNGKPKSPKNKIQSQTKRSPTITKKQVQEIFERLKALETQKTTPKQVQIKSPADLYDELRKKYKLHISITYNQLRNMKASDFENPDHYAFMLRFKKSRKDFDLYYGLIKGD